MGEPTRIALVSMEDPNVKAAVKIVPIPNESIDNGCHVQSVLLLLDAVAIAIEASGFPANAKLQLESRSGGEKHEGPVVADASGNYFSVMLPYVKGMSHGRTTLTLKSENCHPSVTFEWGKQRPIAAPGQP